MAVDYPEEGGECPEHGCSAILGYGEVEGCSCHVSPPCSACVENPLRCPDCGWEEDGPSHADKPHVPITFFPEYKVQPLDKTKIDYRIKGHSSCSQICEGVYPEGTTKDEVLRQVKGTFGGRFESFGNGKFRFIAYTD